MEIKQNENYGRHTDDEVSFRGEPIPEVIPKIQFQESDSREVINKITNMNEEQRKNVTIESAHFDKYRLADVKLTTGDIVPVETAIALAENNMLNGYSTGATMRGGRTLRSKPSPNNKNVGIYQLPRF